MSRVKISARIGTFNHRLVRTVADVFFFNEKKNEGNFSKGLDLILTLFRNNTKFKKLMEVTRYKALYDTGDRSREVLEGLKEAEVLLKMAQASQKEWT